MEKIGIISDEAADLPKDIVEKHQIAIVPVKLDWPDLEKMPGENTFQKMRELEKQGIQSFGKTSQPSPNDFLEKYKNQLEKFDKIICITLTSKLSETYNSAIQARNFLSPEKQKRVFVIDSLNASCGQALSVFKTIDLIKTGDGVEEIVVELERLIPKVRLLLMVSDPKWLEASGRIPHLVANLLRTMAQVGIRPMLTFREGILVPAGIKMGAKDITTVLLKQFKREVKKLTEKNQKIRVAITHGDYLEGAQRIKENLEKDFKNIEVAFLNIINNVVGAPTGPNTLALSWCEA